MVLPKATRIKANNGSKVRGAGFCHRRGNTTIKIKITSGYKASGRTKVLPPNPEGKNGKLVTGKETRKKAQKNF
jgi:hypothetical protein